MGRNRRQDDFTKDMFEVPRPANPLAGSMYYSLEVSSLVGDILHESPLKRHEFAAEMSRLSSKEVTKAMLDGYTSEARIEFNLPLYLAPVLEEVGQSHLLATWYSDKRGGRMLFGRDVLRAELGKLEQVKAQATQKIKELKKIMGGK